MSKRAFTLIELLVVIAIVGILAGFVFVQLSGANGTALDAKKKSGVDAIRKAVLFYQVEKGSYPIENDVCTVGEDCTNLDNLENLPNIPSDLTYTYQSNGTDCTISITLSTGYAYEYSCLTNLYATNVPTDGSCGSANGANFYSAPSTDLCSSGSASSVSGTGPWSWECAGAYGGASVSCSTGGSIVDGSCGSANNLGSYSTPSANLCLAGTATSVSGSDPWYWSCTGLNTGTTASCSAYMLLVNGTHTAAQCPLAGGTVVSDGSGNNMCRFNSSSCGNVSGWTQYQSWSTTAGSAFPSLTATCGPNTWTCAGQTHSHSWSNSAPEGTQQNFMHLDTCILDGVTSMFHLCASEIGAVGGTGTCQYQDVSYGGNSHFHYSGWTYGGSATTSVTQVGCY